MFMVVFASIRKVGQKVNTGFPRNFSSCKSVCQKIGHPSQRKEVKLNILSVVWDFCICIFKYFTCQFSLFIIILPPFQGLRDPHKQPFTCRRQWDVCGIRSPAAGGGHRTLVSQNRDLLTYQQARSTCSSDSKENEFAFLKSSADLCKVQILDERLRNRLARKL